MTHEYENLEQILEAALLAAGEPLTVDRILQMFPLMGRPSKEEVCDSLKTLAEKMELRGVELREVASGYRFQAKPEFAEFLQRLRERKPPKYSRAFLETLALIVYRQPITRGEIEDVRGVAVSSNIIRTLQEREWVKVVGARDVPGKPALLGTTKQFLDDFNLQSLSELPPLKEIMNIEEVGEQLEQQLEQSSEAAEPLELPEEVAV